MNFTSFIRKSGQIRQNEISDGSLVHDDKLELESLQAYTASIKSEEEVREFQEKMRKVGEN
jgi:hypothetical protein